MSTQLPLFLDDEDVRDLIDMPEAIDLLEGAFLAFHNGEAGNMPRRRIAGGGSILNVLAGHSGASIGTKTYTVSAHGAPMHVLLYAADGTGLQAVLAAGWMSLLRTGAASGLAARHLAAQAERIAIIGSGGQALSQVSGVLAATGAQSVAIFSRTAERRDRFAEKVSESFGVTARSAASAADALHGADVVITMTNAAEPVVQLAEVEAGTLVIAAGNNNPARREIDPALFGIASRVIVDDPVQAMVEAGELMTAVSDGLLAEESLVPLGAVVAGEVSRPTGDEITIFESVGIGLEDVVIGARLLALARERGLGHSLGAGKAEG